MAPGATPPDRARHARVLVPVAVAAVVAAALVGGRLLAGAATSPPDETGRTAPSPSAPSAPSALSAPSPPSPPSALSAPSPETTRTRPYTFHGLTLSVPSAWALNATRCGVPVKDTVVLPGPVTACLLTRRPRVDSVTFATEPAELVRLTDRTTTRLSIDRHAAVKVTGTSTYNPEGDHVMVLAVPSLGAGALIRSPHEAVVERIAASARVVDVDAHGCVASRRDLVTLPTNRPPARPGAQAQLVPGRPAHVAVCRYGGGGLEQSAELTGTAARRFADRLNALPPGLSAANHADYADSVCDEERERPGGYTVVATYDQGPPVTAWVRLGTCLLLGASNGTRTGQRTADLTDAVTGLAGGTSWPTRVGTAP